MKSFFLLDAVLSTKIITLAYWLMLIVVWFVGFAMMGATPETTSLGTPVKSAPIFLGLCIILFGTLIVRLWAEFMIVIFKIQQNTRQTTKLLKELKGRNAL